MDLDPELIEAMFAKHGVSGPWESLTSTGVANRIFGTEDVVLRVATDHPDGLVDARTESVAAPVARAAGVLTPRLLAFDDTRTLVNRPFPLWERVHGETLGSTRLPPSSLARVWQGVGRELAKLHVRVSDCADPQRYLDDPARDQDVNAAIRRLVEAKRLDTLAADQLRRLVEELRPHIATGIQTRFIHDDIHPMNVMCSSEGEVLAIIDWGDAGWGDPTLDFVAMPDAAIRPALEGYEAVAPGSLGEFPRARIAWNRLIDALEDCWETPGQSVDLAATRAFLRSALIQIRSAG
ncbi:MAG: aminoglycoside phosphotransferase family protein [Acidobacteria bacterium]|nr:aminoglycoside phosphotransferase family protein [Acidobacteriota bacterium]